MIRALILTALLILLSGAPAAARILCDTRDVVVAGLSDTYGEVRRGGGLAGPTEIFEIWASDRPPYTWTILRTSPNGLACLMAIGEGWQDEPKQLDGDKT